MLEISNFTISLISLLVAIATLLLIDPEKHAKLRGILAILFIIVTVFFAVMGFSVLQTNSVIPLSPREDQEANNEPNSSSEMQPPTPTTRSLVVDFETISLQPWTELTSLETNLGLDPGLNTLLDIPFETGWTASTQCLHLPDQHEIFRFNTNLSNPISVHLLLQAGMGFTRYNGKQIGNVILSFSNGNKSATSLVLGTNIRDWAWENDLAVNTTTSPNVRPGWQGTTSDGTVGGMDILSIKIDPDLLESTLTGIEISDISQSTTNEINPCIHLVALTVEFLR